MKKLSNFEDIFNKIIKEFQGKEVEISSRQDGVNITTMTSTIVSVRIKPLSKRKSKKWNKKGQKVGLIIISGRKKWRKTKINIPFLLGYNTMEAVFLKKGATIKTFDMEFTIKKKAAQKRQLA
ncbi:MAG: hypothetical protein ACOC21_01830 [Halanaerobiales bacterium]